MCRCSSTETPLWPLWKCTTSTPPTAWRWQPAPRQAPAWSAHESGSLCQRSVSDHLISPWRRILGSDQRSSSKRVAHLRSSWKNVSFVLTSWPTCSGPGFRSQHLAHTLLSFATAVVSAGVYQQPKVWTLTCLQLPSAVCFKGKEARS